MSSLKDKRAFSSAFDPGLKKPEQVQYAPYGATDVSPFRQKDPGGVIGEENSNKLQAETIANARKYMEQKMKQEQLQRQIDSGIEQDDARALSMEAPAPEADTQALVNSDINSRRFQQLKQKLNKPSPYSEE